MTGAAPSTAKYVDDASWRLRGRRRGTVTKPRVHACDPSAHRGDRDAVRRDLRQAVEHGPGQARAFRTGDDAAAEVHAVEIAGAVKRQRAQQHGVEEREHCGVQADAKAERDDDGDGNERVLPEHAPAIAEVLEQHPGVFLWRLDDYARQRLEPETCAVPHAGGAAVAIDERHQQLAAVLVAERGRVEGQQRAKCPDAQRVFRVGGHSVRSFGAAGPTRARQPGVGEDVALPRRPRPGRFASAGSSGAAHHRVPGRAVRPVPRSVPFRAAA